MQAEGALLKTGTLKHSNRLVQQRGWRNQELRAYRLQKLPALTADGRGTRLST